MWFVAYNYKPSHSLRFHIHSLRSFLGSHTAWCFTHHPLDFFVDSQHDASHTFTAFLSLIHSLVIHLSFSAFLSWFKVWCFTVIHSIPSLICSMMFHIHSLHPVIDSQPGDSPFHSLRFLVDSQPGVSQSFTMFLHWFTTWCFQVIQYIVRSFIDSQPDVSQSFTP